MAIFVLDTFYTLYKVCEQYLIDFSLVNFNFNFDIVDNLIHLVSHLKVSTIIRMFSFFLQCLGSLDMQDLSDSQMSDENGVERWVAFMILIWIIYAPCFFRDI